MELYDKLADIFEINTINIDKANRSTLKKYAVRTKFQKRREAFYSICEEGHKSKVAICKSAERPQWVHNLETLKTKQLRSQLKGFLKELGLFVDPKVTNMNKLAKQKNWHAVVHMQDESKTGGMHGGVGPPPGSAPPPSGGRRRPVAHRAAAPIRQPLLNPAGAADPGFQQQELDMGEVMRQLQPHFRDQHVNRTRLDALDKLIDKQRTDQKFDSKLDDLAKLFEKKFDRPPPCSPLLRNRCL